MAHTLKPAAGSQTVGEPSSGQIPDAFFGPHEVFSVFSLSRIWGQLTSHIAVIADSTLYSRLVMKAEPPASRPFSTYGKESGVLSLLTLARTFQGLEGTSLLQRNQCECKSVVSFGRAEGLDFQTWTARGVE